MKITTSSSITKTPRSKRSLSGIHGQSMAEYNQTSESRSRCIPSLYISSKEFSYTPFYRSLKWDYPNPPLIGVDCISLFFRSMKDSHPQYNQIVEKLSSKWNSSARSHGLLKLLLIWVISGLNSGNHAEINFLPIITVRMNGKFLSCPAGTT